MPQPLLLLAHGVGRVWDALPTARGRREGGAQLSRTSCPCLIFGNKWLFSKRVEGVAGDSSAKLASGSRESFARVQGLLTCFLALVSSLSRLSSY